MPSRSDLPGKLQRASSQAMAMPKGRLPATLNNATWRLRRIASHSASVSWSSGTDYREPGRQEHIGRLRSLQIGEESTGSLIVMAGDQGERIDDRKVSGFGKCRHDA